VDQEEMGRVKQVGVKGVGFELEIINIFYMPS
jgi:hypothetical protein